MRQLLYASNTTRDAPDGVLDDILEASRRNNIKVGITGVLLYIDGGFMQVLEGEGAAVAETFARICKDRRHWNTNVLLDRDVPRAFGDWSMGFKRITNEADLNVFQLSEDAIHGKVIPGAPAEVVTLLRTFYRINTRMNA